MILKFKEFINEQHLTSEQEELDKHEELSINQGDDLSAFYWDAKKENASKFDSVFKAEPLSDSTLTRMMGKSYPGEDKCEVSIRNLRYLIIPHYDGNGAIRIGELVCHKKASDDFLYLFKELFKHKYPIERMVLIDDYDGDDSKSMAANNTSSFNYRVIAGTDKLSRHAFGMAIDINPLYNPYVKGTFVSPESGEPYVNRGKEFKYKISRKDLVYKILHDKFGFTWGGDWENCKDYQHFEK
jgi:hypothetical protein